MSGYDPSEAQFQTAVIDLARLLGWRVAHFRPAQTAKGWRTPVEADGKGWPDLVLAHPLHGLIFRELKSATGMLTPEQAEWISLLQMTGADAATWRPMDMDRITHELGAERSTR